MAETGARFFTRDARAEWVRLRTLILLRWLAVAGQAVAILVATRVLHLDIPAQLCILAIGASALANIAATFIYPENKRLSETEVLLFLLFDLCQLALLLFLTGGLNNPFAVLILAPVTISATALGLRSTVTVALVALVMISALARVHVTLQTSSGVILQMPPVFLAGFWAALVIGVVFLAAYARRVTVELHAMSTALAATQMALAREQKLTDLSGVVAAAAHELGTPLATIKLVSTELAEELAGNAELSSDAALIREQADRCRDILRDMGRVGKDDRHMAQAPIGDVVAAAADPHSQRGKAVLYEVTVAESRTNPMPVIVRRPEIIHGMRNLVQNAVDFARERVWIDIAWTDDRVEVRVADDGRGYPPDLIGRIGDPFVRRNSGSRNRRDQRPEYEGMGLGLFIAKTLLERSGATVSFANGSDSSERSGAIVHVVWPRSRIEAFSGPLGENPKIAD